MNFLDLVSTAVFQALDNAQRSQAEKEILNMKDQNIDQFFLHCASGLENPNISPQLRQACGTLLKRCISLKTQQGVYNWLLCSNQVKQQVKDSCLSMLVYQDIIIKRSAANAISEICAVELPRQEWPEIINNLVANSEKPDQEIKMSAVMTLGFICESLRSNLNQAGGTVNPAILPDDVSQKILYGICQGLNDVNSSLDIQRISLKALQDAIMFMRGLFERQKEIKTYVCGILCNAAISNERTIKTLALQCLIDCVRLLFDFVGKFIHFHLIVDYLNAFMQVTLSSFENPDLEVSMPAMEIWSVFFSEIKDRIVSARTVLQVGSQSPYPQLTAQHQFAMINYQQFLQPLLRNLFINDAQNEDDTGDATIQESAFRTLATLVDIVPDTYQWLTEFISNNLMNQDWKHRKAAILCFGALAETQDNNEISGLMFNALSPLVRTLQDSHPRVKAVGARVLSKVAEHYPDVFYKHHESPSHITIIGEALYNKSNISRHIVWVLTFITEQLSRPEICGVYSDQKFQLLGRLASVAVMPEIDSSNYAMIDTCFMGILNVIYSISDPKMCTDYLQQFHSKLVETNNFDQQRKRHIQSGLLTSMHGCLMRLGPNDLTEQISQQIFTTFIQFVQDPELNSDGLYAMSGLASCLRHRFQTYAPDVLTLLNRYLQNPDMIDAFKTSLFCLADLARGLEEGFADYLGVLDYLIGLIHNPSFDRDMKIQVYTTIADLALGTRTKCLPYLDKLVNLVKVGFQGCVALTREGTLDSLDYADRLKEHLMSYYTCLMHAFCDGSLQNQQLLETLPWLFEFAETTCDRKLRPTVVKHSLNHEQEFVRLTLNALLDAGNFFHTTQQGAELAKRYLTSKFVTDLIQTIGRFTHQQENCECYSYATEVSKHIHHQSFQNHSTITQSNPRLPFEYIEQLNLGIHISIFQVKYNQGIVIMQVHRQI